MLYSKIYSEREEMKMVLRLIYINKSMALIIPISLSINNPSSNNHKLHIQNTKILTVYRMFRIKFSKEMRVNLRYRKTPIISKKQPNLTMDRGETIFLAKTLTKC